MQQGRQLRIRRLGANLGRSSTAGAKVKTARWLPPPQFETGRMP